MEPVSSSPLPDMHISSTKEPKCFYAPTQASEKFTGVRSEANVPPSASAKLLSAAREPARFAEAGNYVSSKTNRIRNCHSTCVFQMRASRESPNGSTATGTSACDALSVFLRVPILRSSTSGTILHHGQSTSTSQTASLSRIWQQQPKSTLPCQLISTGYTSSRIDSHGTTASPTRS